MDAEGRERRCRCRYPTPARSDSWRQAAITSPPLPSRPQPWSPGRVFPNGLSGGQAAGRRSARLPDSIAIFPGLGGGQSASGKWAHPASHRRFLGAAISGSYGSDSGTAPARACAGCRSKTAQGSRTSQRRRFFLLSRPGLEAVAFSWLRLVGTLGADLGLNRALPSNCRQIHHRSKESLCKDLMHISQTNSRLLVASHPRSSLLATWKQQTGAISKPWLLLAAQAQQAQRKRKER